MVRLSEPARLKARFVKNIYNLIAQVVASSAVDIDVNRLTRLKTGDEDGNEHRQSVASAF